MKFTNCLEYQAILGFMNCEVRLSKITDSDKLDCESFDQDSIDKQSSTSASTSSSESSSISCPMSANGFSRDQKTICKECTIDVKKLAPCNVPRHFCSSSASSSKVSSSSFTTPSIKKRIKLKIQREPGSLEDDKENAFFFTKNYSFELWTEKLLC